MSYPALKILKNLFEVSYLCLSCHLSPWQQQIRRLSFPALLGILFLQHSHKHVLFSFTWTLSPSISYSILLYLRGSLLSFRLPGPYHRRRRALTHNNKHTFQLKPSSTWWMWLPFNFNYRRSLASWKSCCVFRQHPPSDGSITAVGVQLLCVCVGVCVHAHCYTAEYTVQQIHVDKAQP